MKTIDELADFFKEWGKNIDKRLMDAQQETAQKIWEDVIEYAPYKSGDYVASIQVDETIKEGNTISTFIGSDLCVGPTKWTGGKIYNLGYLLENGTFEHAIPNAFGKGFYYGFTDSKGVFHKGTLDKDWHPGAIAQPHYALALEKNRKLYKDNIQIGWRPK